MRFNHVACLYRQPALAVSIIRTCTADCIRWRKPMVPSQRLTCTSTCAWYHRLDRNFEELLSARRAAMLLAKRPKWAIYVKSMSIQHTADLWHMLQPLSYFTEFLLKANSDFRRCAQDWLELEPWTSLRITSNSLYEGFESCERSYSPLCFSSQWHPDWVVQNFWPCSGELRTQPQ